MITISAHDFDSLKSNPVFSKFLSEATSNSIQSEQDALQFLDKNLPPEQAQKIRGILNNKDAVSALLSSEDAKKLMKMIMEGEKHG